MSAINWPRPSLYSAFYEKVIQDKPYAWRFSELKNVCTRYSNCSHNSHLKQRHLIEDNFAKVSIVLGDNMHATVKDNVKVSVFSFLSQLGGALNLWSGITLVVLIEIMEFIFKLSLDTTKSEGGGELPVAPVAEDGTKL